MGNTFHSDVLQGVIVFSIGATSLWSGRGKLTIEDLGDAAEELPPAALASLGSKRLFPKEEIRKLETYKRKMARVIAAYGTPFLNGRAVPVECAEACARELNAVVADARKAVDEFMKQFDANLKQWHTENAKWAHLLAAGTPEREAVRKRINFGFDAYPVGVPDGEALATKMRESVDSLGSNLLFDIAKDARDFVKKALQNRQVAASQKTVNPIRRLLVKLKSLAFLNHRALPVLKVASKLVDQLPSKGKLEDSDFLLLVQIGNLLSDVREMERVADEVLAGTAAEAVAERICGHALQKELTPATADVSGSVTSEAEAAAIDAAALFGADTASEGAGEAIEQEREVMAESRPQVLPDERTKPIVPVAPVRPAINPMRSIAF